MKNTKTISKREMLRKRKQKKRNKAILMIIFFLLLFFIGAGGFYVYDILSSTTKVEISKDKETLNIPSYVSEKKDIVNIALFGLDKREKNEPSRSDSIIIVTVDTKHEKLKMTSLMRDTYVEIDGHGKDKLTHAYAFGGPELAIKTINKNFDLNITDFVAVDFGELAKIIDALGGVTVDVKREEIKHINDNVKEQAGLTNTQATYVSNSGVQKLNGIQAVGYARIRATAGGDYERTDRQRTVLEGMFQSVKSAGLTEYPSIMKELLPLVETSLSTTELLKLGTNALTIGVSTIEQSRYPLDEHLHEGFIGKLWYIQYDREETIEALHEYIFEDSSVSFKNDSM